MAESVLFDSRWISNHGIGRVACEYRKRLGKDFKVRDLSCGGKPSHPGDFIRVKREFIRSGADIFISPGYNGLPGEKRQIFFIHDMIHMSEREPGGWRKRLYYNEVIRRAAQTAKAVVTVSDAAKSTLLSLWSRDAIRVEVLHNGVSEAFFPRVEGEIHRVSGKFVIFSNMRWHKNFSGMISAFREYINRTENFDDVLYIVGKVTDYSKSVIAAAGISKNVVFCGSVSDDELRNIFCAATCLVMCSFDEGFGLPVIEAMQCGCRVIVSDIPVFREVGGGLATYVNPESIQDMSIALEAIRNAPLEDRIGRLDPRFSWDRSYEKLKTLVEYF